MILNYSTMLRSIFVPPLFVVSAEENILNCPLWVAEFVLQDYLFFICSGRGRCRASTLCTGATVIVYPLAKPPRSRKFLTRTLTVTCNQPQASPSLP